MTRLRISGIILAVLLIAVVHNTLWSPRSRTSRLWMKLSPEEQTSDDSSYSAVILYLVSQSRASELLESLAALHANVPGPGWPIVLYHTGDYDEEPARSEFISEVRSYIGPGNGSWAFSERLEFVRLDWKWPVGLSTDVNEIQPFQPHVWPGYHQMCAFFSAPIFTEPRLQNVTYYMRLDTDSLIKEPLCYDPFEVMHSRKRAYGYRTYSNDADSALVGVRTLLHNYALEHPEVARRMRKNEWVWPHENAEGEMIMPPLKGYNNNFEIVRLQAFRRPDVKEWLDELVSVPERWYKWRWGDGPLRYATTHMFFDIEQDIEQFCGMRYHHPYNAIADCPCVPL